MQSVATEKSANGLVSEGDVFSVELVDPVLPDSPPSIYPVSLAMDANGFPVEYRLELHTGVCLEGVCKPLVVTLFWDALGVYSRLEYPESEPLTKRAHDPFTPEDYEQLDTILKNKNSILGMNPLSHFVRLHEHDSVESDIDAVSSATMKEVKNAVVSGAAYSSWVLWHWVHDGIADQLIARTLLSCTPEYLVHCLQSEDIRFVRFALQRIQSEPHLDRNEFHGLLVAQIGSNADSSRLILDYFETVADPAPELWEEMSEKLDQIEAYHEVSAVLNLLENRAGESDVVRRNVAKLLRRKNRFVARLAEEFLEN